MIVSCTTLPSRCEHVVETAESLFVGTLPPEKFILNVFRGDFPDGVPAFISDYAKRESRFEVFESDKNYWSATKLIPTLQRFPNSLIAIVDEDKLYQPTVLENLYKKHVSHPKCVVCMKGEIARHTAFGHEILYYGFSSDEEDQYMIPAGGSGTLFPPGAFNGTWVSDADLFLEWQKPHDDRWWWMNYAKNGVKAIGAVRYESDSQFSLKDFKTKDAIHDFLWQPENAKKLDEKFFKWMQTRYPLLWFNVPKIKYSALVLQRNGTLALKDEFGKARPVGRVKK